MVDNVQITAQPEYDIQFWNAMRNKKVREDILAKGRDTSTGTYSMPNVAAGKVMSEIEKESDFRKIATVIRAYKTGYKIFAKDCKDKAEFVAEGAVICMLFTIILFPLTFCHTQGIYKVPAY